MNMDYSQFAKQLVDFQKMSFANWYNAFDLVQDQAESAMKTVLGQNAYVPAQLRDTMNEWFAACRQEQVRFRDFVDQGFSNMKPFTGRTSKTASTGSKK